MKGTTMFLAERTERTPSGKQKEHKKDNCERPSFVGPTLVHWPALPGGEYRKATDLYLVGRLVEEYTCLCDQDAEVERFTSMLQKGISVEMALEDL